MKAWYKEQQRNAGLGKPTLVQMPQGALVVWKACSCCRVRFSLFQMRNAVRRDVMLGSKDLLVPAVSLGEEHAAHLISARVKAVAVRVVMELCYSAGGR